jgi:hypothetical protein
MSGLVLPPFFPRRPNECGRPADTFFKCFSDKSKKESPEDADSGKRGLSECESELKRYKACMEGSKSVQAKLAKAQYRVQEEYRVKV